MLPYSILIGVGVPSLIALLAPAGSSVQQIALVLRQFHPIWTAITHLVLSIFAPPAPQPKDAAARGRSVLAALQPVYAIATYLTIVPHVAAMTLSMSSLLLPQLFTPSAAASFHPVQVFLPPRFYPEDKIMEAQSIGHGTHMFLQWDEIVSVVSILVWAIAVNLSLIHI